MNPFTIKSWVSPDGSQWLVQVFTCEGHSIGFTGPDEPTTTRKAEIFMEGELARLSKSDSAVHARRAGRKRQSLNGVSGG